MNKRQAKKVYYNSRPGHRFDTIQRAWSKWLSVLSRKYGVKVGFRLFRQHSGIGAEITHRPHDYKIGGHHGKA